VHRRRHPQTVVGLIPSPQHVKRGVGVSRELGERVEERETFGVELVLGCGLGPADVSGQHLGFIECSEVAYEASGDEAQAVWAGERDAEQVRCDLAGPTPLPSVGRGEEAVAGDVENVVVEVEASPPCVVELRVDQPPGCLARIPYLSHPVVLEVPRFRYAAKPQRARAGTPRAGTPAPASLG
jgi:hypothetical protein